MMEKEKEETLSSLLQSYGSAAVALSGGVDSAVLLMAAVRTLGTTNVAAVTAASELLAEGELEDAKRCAALAGVPLTMLPADDLASPDVARNDERRCYYCKKRRFEMLAASDASSMARTLTMRETIAQDSPQSKSLPLSSHRH